MSEPIRSADVLVRRIAKSPNVLGSSNAIDELQKMADEVTESLPPPAFVTDRWTYRIVVIALGIVSIAAILGAILLSAQTPAGTTIQIPDVLTALGAASIGALAGLLAPSPGGRSG